MISSLFTSIFKVTLFMIKAIGFVYHLASATNLGFLFICGIGIFLLSRYFRLKQPNLPKNIANAIDGSQHIDRKCSAGHQISQIDSNDAIEWCPIANRAACLDHVENSRSAIENCVEQSCQNILLDFDITKCGQLIILHQNTLQRVKDGMSNGFDAGVHRSYVSFSRINTIKFDDLKSLNIAKNNPLGEKHPPESILQFNDLMHLLDVHEKTNIFLLMGSTNKQIISNISRHFENNPERFKRVVICSRSPTVIYQLRKQNPQFICALWLDKITKLRLPSILLNSPIFPFVYGLLYRNIIAVLTGISAVFISKHDFNAHIGQMWRELDVKPIIYTVNSPNEKRYFQHTLRTQYLTESLRSEPSNFVKGKINVKFIP